MAGVKGRSGGHNRASAQEHRMRGTYRADRHGPIDAGAPPPAPTGEPSTRPVVVQPPTLSRAERRFWDQVAPLLASARLLPPSDVELVADWCRSAAAVEDRSRRLAAEFRKRRPDIAAIRVLDLQTRAWMARKARLAGEIGLTPLSRQRAGWSGHRLPTGDAAVRTPPAGAPKSKLQELQEQAASLRRPLEVKGDAS